MDGMVCRREVSQRSPNTVWVSTGVNKLLLLHERGGIQSYLLPWGNWLVPLGKGILLERLSVHLAISREFHQSLSLLGSSQILTVQPGWTRKLDIIRAAWVREAHATRIISLLPLGSWDQEAAPNWWGEVGWEWVVRSMIAEPTDTSCLSHLPPWTCGQAVSHNS